MTFLTTCRNFPIKAFRISLACFFGLVLAGVTHAAVLEEIVVTAQKREQKIQDVGISVTAFSGEQMKELGFTISVDMVAQTPGLNVVSPFGVGDTGAGPGLLPKYDRHASVGRGDRQFQLVAAIYSAAPVRRTY